MKYTQPESSFLNFLRWAGNRARENRKKKLFFGWMGVAVTATLPILNLKKNQNLL
jgi:hypothetical protein